MDENFYRQADGKRTMTVLFCGAANGVMLPPMIIFAAERIYKTWMENAPLGTVFAATKKGWVDGPCLIKWLDMLEAYFEELEDPQPRILVLDNFGLVF